MATTTPNFGWPVPTSTDLVKDGAIAIEGLGDAIDASLLDLKGGTTGQVLTKASGSDMDFSWATASSGSSYADNAMLNSSFNVWQRGTSFAIPSGVPTYFADRFQITRSATGCTGSRQATGDSTNLPFIQYCARVARDSGNTSTTAIYLTHSLDTVNTIPLAGKTVTLSYYARRGANYSATSNALEIFANTGTGTDQNINAGYTGSSGVLGSSVTLTTTWQRFSHTISIGATATEFGFYHAYTPTGTAGANDYFEITGYQLEIASSASAYHPNQPTYATELAACQRYYWRTSNSAVNNANLGGTGFSYSTSAGAYWVNNPVAMRTVPTAIDAANLRVYDITGAAVYTATATISTDSTPINGVMNFAVTGITANRVVRLDANTTGGYLGFSAEL